MLSELTVNFRHFILATSLFISTERAEKDLADIPEDTPYIKTATLNPQKVADVDKITPKLIKEIPKKRDIDSHLYSQRRSKTELLA